MKLRNKKTGEVVEPFGITCINGRTFVQFDDGKGTFKFEAHSLAELNDMWEDYEEPKGIKSITASYDYNRIIIGFYSRQETAKAYEKLEAWKRLKDKGFGFNYWDVRNNDGGWQPLVDLTVRDDFCYERDDVPANIKKDLDLLFGGEETCSE